jgi:nicotinate-nucleotide adenylyltransferase
MDGMRIGVFGGTFDPPHLAHRILAAEALQQLALDQLVWVLTPDPPHKQGMSILSLEQRLRMVEAVTHEDEEFELSKIEIDRPPPHYALVTVTLLQEQHPDDHIIYLMGGDSLRDLPTWHRPLEFVQTCAEIGVMRRPGDQIDLAELDEILPGLKRKVRIVQAPLLEISATDIRKRILEGRTYRYFLPEAVWQIIQQEGYYLDSTP